MVPHIAERKRISGFKNFRSTPQKDFCNKIGTKRTGRAARLMSVDRGKAEAAFRTRQGSF
jgi:hypothetical protein